MNKLSYLIIACMFVMSHTIHAKISWWDTLQTMCCDNLDTANYYMDHYPPPPPPEIEQEISKRVVAGFKDTLYALRKLECRYGPVPSKRTALSFIRKKFPIQRKWLHVLNKALTRNIPLPIPIELHEESYAHMQYDELVHAEHDESVLIHEDVNG